MTIDPTTAAARVTIEYAQDITVATFLIVFNEEATYQPVFGIFGRRKSDDQRRDCLHRINSSGFYSCNMTAYKFVFVDESNPVGGGTFEVCAIRAYTQSNVVVPSMTASGTPSDSATFALQNPVRRQNLKFDFSVAGKEYSTYKSAAVDPKTFTLDLGDTTSVHSVVFIGAFTPDPALNDGGKKITIHVGANQCSPSRGVLDETNSDFGGFFEVLCGHSGNQISIRQGGGVGDPANLVFSGLAVLTDGCGSCAQFSYIPTPEFKRVVWLLPLPSYRRIMQMKTSTCPNLTCPQTVTLTNSSGIGEVANCISLDPQTIEVSIDPTLPWCAGKHSLTFKASLVANPAINTTEKLDFYVVKKAGCDFSAFKKLPQTFSSIAYLMNETAETTLLQMFDQPPECEQFGNYSLIWSPTELPVVAVAQDPATNFAVFSTYPTTSNFFGQYSLTLRGEILDASNAPLVNDWTFDFFSFEAELGPVADLEVNLQTTSFPAAYEMPFWALLGPNPLLNFEFGVQMFDTATSSLGPLPSWATFDSSTLELVIGADATPEVGEYDLRVWMTEPINLPNFVR